MKTKASRKQVRRYCRVGKPQLEAKPDAFLFIDLRWVAEMSRGRLKNVGFNPCNLFRRPFYICWHFTAVNMAFGYMGSSET